MSTLQKHSLKALRRRAQSSRMTDADIEEFLSHAERVTGSHYWMDDDTFAELKHEHEPRNRRPCSNCGGL